MPHQCGSELCIEEVIAHREVLRVIPQRRDRVAIVITHIHARPAACGIRAFRKLVGQPVVIGLLFVGVVVVVRYRR